MSKAQIAQKPRLQGKPIYKPSQLKNILVTKTGRARSSLNQLYVVLNSRFKKQRAFTKCGKVISISRLHTDALYTSREELAEKTGKDEDTITKQLAELEAEGLILRDHESKKGSYNKLKIYLLKDTPHFINPNGIELEKITHLNNHTNSEYLKEKYGIDRTDKVPHLKLVKSTDLDNGGILKNADTNNTGEENISHDIFSSSVDNNEQNKKIFSVVKNECVETSQQKATQQKSSLGDDFAANTENLERNWKLDYGHLSPKPIEPAETPIASDYVLGDTTAKTEAKKRTSTPPILTNQAKEEKPMSTPQTQLKPRQELNCQILKTFSTETAEELQQKLDIKPIAPNKIGLAFKQGLELKNNEKQQLRETIQLVYGKSVKMILIKPVKPEMATKEDTEKRSEPKPLTPEESKWEAVKTDILESLFADQKKYYQSYFARVEIVSLEGRKLKLQGKWDVCEKMKEKQITIEQMAAKHDVDIEVKNLTDHDTLHLPFIKPNLDFLEE